MIFYCAGLNSRLSGSSSHLALAGKSARAGGLSAWKGGVAGQRNGLVAKSWSDLSSAAINSTPSPRDFGQFSLHDIYFGFSLGNMSFQS